MSSYSSGSVSTISTNISHSSSLRRTDPDHTGQSQLMSNLDVNRRRRRSRSSSMSYTSQSPHDRKARNGSQGRGLGSHRDVRLSLSPDDRKETRYGRNRNGGRAAGPITSRRSRSISSESSFERRRRYSLNRDDRSKRRRRSSRSPDDRGRERDLYGKRGSRRTRSPSESRDRSEVTRHRKSMTPGLPSKALYGSRPRHPPAPINRGNSYPDDNDRYGSSSMNRNENIIPNRPTKNAPISRKERSLSPFSKRLALTQAMNHG